MSREFRSTDELLKALDKEFEVLESTREFTTIKEEMEFKTLYLSFIEKYQTLIEDVFQNKSDLKNDLKNDLILVR